MSTKNDKVFKKISVRLDKFEDEFGKEFLARLKRRTPVRSGLLRRSWELEVEEDAIVISNRQEYAGFVESGTPDFSGAHMLKTTVSEAQRIADVAAQKAKSGTT